MDSPATNEPTLLMKLESIQTKLKKFCHTDDCKVHPFSCPMNCGCGRVLDLDTAIAWNLAQEIDWLKRFIGFNSKPHEKEVFMFKETKNYIACMRLIVSRHWRQNKELDDLAYQTKELANEVAEEFPFKEE